MGQALISVCEILRYLVRARGAGTPGAFQIKHERLRDIVVGLWLGNTCTTKFLSKSF
jgi:hypothetical protein